MALHKIEIHGTNGTVESGVLEYEERRVWRVCGGSWSLRCVISKVMKAKRNRSNGLNKGTFRADDKIIAPRFLILLYKSCRIIPSRCSSRRALRDVRDCCECKTYPRIVLRKVCARVTLFQEHRDFNPDLLYPVCVNSLTQEPNLMK